MDGCWLCRYNQTPDAKILCSFITDNAGTMEPAQVASQVSQDLKMNFPDAEGTDVEMCLQHIETHTLNPICRISSMLRALLRLSDDLQATLRRLDEQGNCALDPKLVETYLKVQAQIISIYRQTEVNKLMFSDR
jgi:hypothetical protein